MAAPPPSRSTGGTGARQASPKVLAGVGGVILIVVLAIVLLMRSPAGRGLGIGLDGTGPHLVTGPLYHASPMGFASHRTRGST